MKKSYCHVLPAIGGPIKVATPWNISNKPKALVNLSIPSRSTSTTDVKPTYTPVKYRLTNEMFAYKEAICFCFVFCFAPCICFYFLFFVSFCFCIFTFFDQKPCFLFAFVSWKAQPQTLDYILLSSYLHQINRLL